MKKSRATTFTCVGNGGYYNRGCEAIVRGTLRILEEAFPGAIRARIGFYGDPRSIAKQGMQESDERLETFHQISRLPRWSRAWLEQKCNSWCGTNFSGRQRPLKARLSGAEACLILGGDTYSLDYGKPTRYIEDDRVILEQGLPLVLWAASTGPFSKDPTFETMICDHLRRLSGVFVRERRSLDYLSSQGVSENVRLVADPAFLMEPQAVHSAKLGFEMPTGAIGINVSPLIARYFLRRRVAAWAITHDDVIQWANWCVELICKVRQSEERPILLIPHVVHASPSIGDGFLLETIAEKLRLGRVRDVYLVPEYLNARELKWIISQCFVFMGARTHSTIASLSSAVPTLTISFSVKAAGINEDLFGNCDYLVDSTKLDLDECTEKLRVLCASQRHVHTLLQMRLPEIQARGMKAGEYLRHLLPAHE
jgi:colanic acid/amylovoran biosynthesis protein